MLHASAVFLLGSDLNKLNPHTDSFDEEENEWSEKEMQADSIFEVLEFFHGRSLFSVSFLLLDIG